MPFQQKYGARSLEKGGIQNDSLTARQSAWAENSEEAVGMKLFGPPLMTGSSCENSPSVVRQVFSDRLLADAMPACGCVAMR